MGWNIKREDPPIVKNNFIKPKVQDSSQLSPKKVRHDPVSESFEEFITMINILGNICVKSVKNREALSVIDWRKAVYFIY